MSEAEASSQKRPRRSTQKAKALQAAVKQFLSAVDGNLQAAFNALEQPSHTPTDFALRKVWKEYQFRDPPLFLGYRGPLSARPPIPLVLVHESFSRLGCDLENEELQLSDEDYEMAEGVYKLFTEGFDDEVQQMNKGELSKLFQAYLCAQSFTELQHIKMDGLMIVSRRPHRHEIFILFEDKTDYGQNGYFEALEICRRLFIESGSPSHGILVLRACPYIIIIALIMDRKAKVLLSEPLAHIPFWGPQYRTVLQGAKALKALRNFSDNYIAQDDIDVTRPWAVAAWQNLKPLSKDGLVLCGTSQSKGMVAKFTQHYSEEAHKAWHEMKLAPELLGCRDLGAGWKFVTMEYLDAGWRSVAEAPPDAKSLTEFLQKGHETKYVHGDFRPPNLLINDDGEVKAIGFEWSGLEGKARYPVKLNPDLQWEPTVRRGEVLKKIHDKWHAKKISVDAGASTSRVA